MERQFLESVDRVCVKYGVHFEAWRLVVGGGFAGLNAVLTEAGFDIPAARDVTFKHGQPVVPVPPGAVQRRGLVFDRLWMEWTVLPVGGHVSRRLVQRARQRLTSSPVKRDMKAPRLRKLWTRHVRKEIDLETNKEAEAELRKCHRALKQ